MSVLTCPDQHFETFLLLQPTVMPSCVIRCIMISVGNSACAVAYITHVISMGNKPWQGRTGKGEGAPVCDTPLLNKWPHLTRYKGQNFAVNGVKPTGNSDTEKVWILITVKCKVHKQTDSEVHRGSPHKHLWTILVLWLNTYRLKEVLVHVLSRNHVHGSVAAKHNSLHCHKAERRTIRSWITFA